MGDTFSVSPISVKRTFYASEGCHDFLSKVFCLIVPKKSVEEQFCAVFQKIPMSKGIMDKRGAGFVMGYQGFPSEILCLTVPKKFVGEQFCAVFEKMSGSEKLYG